MEALAEDQRLLSGAGLPASALIEACGQVEETRTRFQLNVTEELALEALAYKLERHLSR